MLTTKERIQFNRVGRIAKDKHGFWVAYTNINDYVAKNQSLPALDKEIQSYEKNMVKQCLLREAQELVKSSS